MFRTSWRSQRSPRNLQRQFLSHVHNCIQFLVDITRPASQSQPPPPLWWLHNVTLDLKRVLVDTTIVHNVQVAWLDSE